MFYQKSQTRAVNTNQQCVGGEGQNGEFVCIPELGLESLSIWFVPPESGVEGERRSDGTSQDRVDQRELCPLFEQGWFALSPASVPCSSGLL